jgi:hypothetical protein
LALEHLESRQLLAADLTGMLPGFEPVDTSDDLSQTAGMLLSASRAHHHAPPEDGSSGIPTSSAEPRSFDGTDNNVANPEWGSTDEQLLRVAPADYGDGISSMAGDDRPSARAISNAIADQDEDLGGNERALSAFAYVWGQFLDHDIDLTEPPTENREAENVSISTGDDYFDPDGSGTQEMPFTRSRYDETTGTDTDNPREQVNQITAWIDGSMIYGSDQQTADSLRSFVDGKMLTSEGDLPLLGEDGFISGDVRVNENIELTAMHALFGREHNWWAEQIASQNPELSDEQIFQQARAIVIAEIQAITYNEFLPSLLGNRALEPYRGYDATVNPNIANEFSTAAYRLGHSLVNDDVEFFGNDGREVREELELREAFNNPTLLLETGIDSIMKYVASSQSQEIDNHVVDGLRNFLFGDPDQGGLDLAALNIQRGRDHGLADYNTVRESYGLGRGESFADITSDLELQQALEEMYSSVDNIDLWIGALAEDHVRGAAVGELIRTIVTDQFERLRDGDRFWYQNVFSGRQLEQLENMSLADIIERNTEVTGLQDNVFFMQAQVKGEVFFDTNRDGDQDRREPGLPGIQVQLLDDEGEVIATTRTRLGGRYQFDDFQETGDYQVRVALPGFLSGTSENPQEFLISSGDVIVRGVDFGIRWDFRNLLGNHNRPSKNPAAIVDTVFRQLGQASGQAEQTDRGDNPSTEDALESGDDSGGLLDDSGNEEQAGRDQHDTSTGTDFTLRRSRRGPVVSGVSG